MHLEVAHLHQRYSEKVVLDELSFSLQNGDIACLLGSSGSGKTTALRAIAGFEKPESGQVMLGNVTLSDKQIFIPAHLRNIGMVFQDHALFPHLNVTDNIAFGLNALTRPERQKRVDQLLELIHLTDYAKAYPHELSGGQQQRIALARSLAPKPKLLLLDEPFSSLDVELRERLAREVREILKVEGVTALIVTHDQHEAFAIADQIGIMHKGRIEQWDTPYSLYHAPKTRYVADFIGHGVFIKGVAKNDFTIETELGNYSDTQPHGFSAGEILDVLIRPENLSHEIETGHNVTVQSKTFNGNDFIYTLMLPSGQTVVAKLPSLSHHYLEVGDIIKIRLNLECLVVFRPNI